MTAEAKAGQARAGLEELLARQPGAAPEPALRSWLEDALSEKGER